MAKKALVGRTGVAKTEYDDEVDDGGLKAVAVDDVSPSAVLRVLEEAKHRFHDPAHAFVVVISKGGEMHTGWLLNAHTMDRIAARVNNAVAAQKKFYGQVKPAEEKPLGVPLAKLAVLVPKLASTFDAEVVATVRAMERILTSGGYDWHSLSECVATNPLPKGKRELPSWRKAVADLLVREDELSEWERDFVTSLAERDRLSEKQMAVLARLIDKYRR